MAAFYHATQLPLFVMTKTCNKCRIEKPLEQFAIQKEGKYGRASYCKVCFSVRHKERYSKHVPLPEAAPGNKICRKCLSEKSLIAFSRASRSPDGHATQCKECVHYRQYVLNREASLARMKRAYEQNKERYQANGRKNWKEHKEQYAATRREYLKRNPLKVREALKRRKVRKRGAHVEWVSYKRILERDGLLCSLCFKPIDPTLDKKDPAGLVFDHEIPIARGGAHTESNIHPAHNVCNGRKYNKLPDELTLYDRRGPDS